MSDQKKDIWGKNAKDLSDAILSELGLDTGQPNFAQARQHFKKAAKEGNAWAQLQYAKYLEKGLGGPKNPSEAKSWKEKAKEAGFQSSKEMLGRLNERVLKEKADSPKPKEYNILIIEDETGTSLLLEKTIQKMGLKATVAHSGEQATALLSAGKKFEIALIDINLPGMTGIEVLKYIKTNKNLAGIKCAMITSNKEKKNIITGQKYGICGWLLKPSKPISIVNLIKRHLPAEALQNFKKSA